MTTTTTTMIMTIDGVPRRLRTITPIAGRVIDTPSTMTTIMTSVDHAARRTARKTAIITPMTTMSRLPQSSRSGNGN
jgi:hypothetical protein